MPDRHYLKLLARDYPTSQAAAAEIVRLNALMSLPKGTEYFFSDLHGEHEAFIHLLRSASGFIRRKVDDLFDKTVSRAERIALSNLIYYPEEELARLEVKNPDMLDWCRVTITRLLEVTRAVSAKYTRQQVRKKLTTGFSVILDELLHVDTATKPMYFDAAVQSLLATKMMDEFITSLCRLIQKLAIDKLHIIGDIFDRGPRADLIMNELIEFKDVDIQWGNHDILWMGAAAGNRACIANVMRQGISYNNFDLLEDGYGINLRSLAVFATNIYANDACSLYQPKMLDENKYDPVDPQLAARMNKAITVIQFKVEGQLLAAHPEYDMADRRLFEKADFRNGTIELDGRVHQLNDTYFPTVDPENPLALTPDEEELINTLSASFRHSEKLQRHVSFLYAEGGMYKCFNNNLLYHGCIPLTANGDFEEVDFDGELYSGKALLDEIEKRVRNAHFSPPHSQALYKARDFLWYLWCGPHSPLFGKSRMATFERLLLTDKELHKETMNPYYDLQSQREICEQILREFGLKPENAHIINGHMPVRIKAGESPIKGDGLLYVIDGGISKAYQKTTGIAGYTLIYNSRYLALAEHQPFSMDAEQRPTDLSPQVRITENMPQRVTVADTDEGRQLTRQISELQELMAAYRTGLLKEKI